MELFDLAADPLERSNLAPDRNKHRTILEEMNARLNGLIEREVGEDIDQMLPGGVDGGRVATNAVNDL